MKIAVPVNEDKASVCISFGRTPLFAIINSESGAVEYIDNSAAASQGGAGIKAAQLLVDHGVAAVLTPRCGENAAQVFDAAQVKLYKTQGDSVKENISAYQKGGLPALSEIHAGYHHHGGR